LVAGSRRATLFLGLFEIQTASSMAIQSGAPGSSKMASGFSRSIGIFTPAVFTPGLGAGAVCSARDPTSATITSLHILAA
jgi:hypothetical protein